MIRKYIELSEQLISMKKRINEVAKDYDLSASDVVIISDITENPRTTAVSTARRTFIKSPALSRVNPRLEYSGLIRVEVDKHDERQKRYIVTAKGKRILSKILDALELDKWTT